MRNSFIVLFAISSVAFAQTAELDILAKKREAEITRINTIYVAELEKLKEKYTREGDLKAANAVTKLLRTFKFADAPETGDANEFENTEWDFKMGNETLGVIRLLPGGKVESQRYAGASWKSVDQNTIEWIYPDKRKMLMRFTSGQRNELSGTWEDGTNRRTMVKTKP